MKKALKNVTILMLWATFSWGIGAQTEDIAAGFNRPNLQEEQALRAILAEPIPQNVLFESLRLHLRAKEAAANKLGDEEQVEAVLRAAVRLLPDPVYKNNLARRLLNKGQFEEGNKLMRQAVAAAENVSNRVFWSANVACDLVTQNKNDAARTAISETTNHIKLAQRDARADWVQRSLYRSMSNIANCLSTLEQRFGRFTQAIEAAEVAEQNARKALALAANERNPLEILFTQKEVASGIARKLQAYRNAGRLQDAEKTLAEYVRYSKEVQLPADYLSGIYKTAGDLRFSQREFLQSEQLIRLSDTVLADLGRETKNSNRTSRARDIFNALAGQKKWPEALKVIDSLDQLAGDDDKLKKQVRYGYDRAVVYFGNHRYAEAAPLFEQRATETRKTYDEHHFFVAQAIGLQGAALWRSGTSQNQALALPLLKAAVRDYMAPVNADYLENIGYRKERREDVFAAYLEALAGTPGEDVTQAIGAADWVRGSSVQEALGDAAVRASATTPALAGVVRREQDAKNEVAGLRRYLSGETGSANSPLPVIAAQMRERIAALEGERLKLQAEIKTKFPDYEKLVHPAPPSVSEVAQQLEVHQALLMLLPTSDAVYVWAVTADRPAAFARVELKEEQVKALVARLRHQFDFAAGAGKQYDSAAAYELYDKLLAPLASAWQGKTQLIIAAGGALSQLPFAVLQTRPNGGFGANAPWLIRQAAIAQVPSLSAWLSIKAIAKSQSAGAPLMAWGDPTFALNSTAATPGAPNNARSITLTRTAWLADLSNPNPGTNSSSALLYSDIPALPDTRVELLEIAQALKADADRDVVLGQSATRNSVLEASRSGLLATKRVIAFATHGLMAGDLPNLTQPALAMAATGAESTQPLAPLLTLEDVLTLKLNADWVVLSACNTAAADGKGEESLSGLARGFFYAGSRSLLVTHWAVESESARLLTTATFTHYVANPQAPKAESLRQAMLSVMAMPQYQHPAYWAPYALVGDGGR